MNEPPAVADLGWAIDSPSLIESGEFKLQLPNELDSSSIDRQQLTRFLGAKPSKRVGRYFEQLILYYLQQVQQFEMVACQKPLVVDGRTIGEIDFLYRDHDGLLTHLEVAVKFYLHIAGTPHDGSNFVGPNASDTFERKTQKLFAHQLPLSKIHFPEVDRRAVLMKGRIYYHAGFDQPQVYPPRMSDSHLRGTWIHSGELDRLRRCASRSWHILQKPYWLTVAPDVDSLTTDQFAHHVQDHFSKLTLPLHCAAIENGREAERVFIVSADWPSHSIAQS